MGHRPLGAAAAGAGWGLLRVAARLQPRAAPQPDAVAMQTARPLQEAAPLLAEVLRGVAARVRVLDPEVPRAGHTRREMAGAEMRGAGPAPPPAAGRASVRFVVLVVAPRTPIGALDAVATLATPRAPPPAAVSPVAARALEAPVLRAAGAQGQVAVRA